jgi:hypothetical protein
MANTQKRLRLPGQHKEVSYLAKHGTLPIVTAKGRDLHEALSL